MKDAKGHGSNTGTRGMRLVKTHVLGPHMAKVYKNPEWGENVVKTFRNGAYQPKNDYHTDDMADAHGTAMSQLQRWSDQEAKSKPVGDKAASAALASGAKSAAAPVHDSMSSRDTDAFGRPRSSDSKAEYDEYSRDLTLRSRNGQVGSGMKYRG